MTRVTGLKRAWRIWMSRRLALAQSRAYKFSRVAASQLMAGRSSVGFLANGIEGSDGQKQAPRPVAERMTMMCLNFIP